MLEKIPKRASVPFFVCLLILGSAKTVLAQTDTRFWFVAPEVSVNHSDRPIAFRMTSENAATTITISTPADPTIFDTTFILPANSTVTVPLTHRINLIENQPHNQVLNKGFLIESTELITAYYEVISAGNNPDIFALKGRNALGTDFYITAQNIMENVHGHERIDIVATENNTVVTVVNTAAFAGGIGAGSTTTITLQRGQSYSLRTNSQNANVSQAGTRITSTKPIAITYIDDSVRGGSEFGGGCYDLLGDQHIPVNLLGQEYIVMRGFLNTSPSTNTFAEIVLITAVQDSTLIQLNGGATVATLQTGQSFTYRLSDSTVFIQSTKPIYVAHISGFGCETGLAILPSISCTGSRQVGFTRTTNEFFGINIMTKTVNVSGFALNGNPISSTLFQPVPGTAGVWQFTRLSFDTIQVPIGSGNLLTNSLGPFHMGIINGGASTGCRYGYFSDFARYLMSGSTNSPPSNPLCEGSTLELYADSLEGATYVWTNPAGSPFSSQQNPSIPNLSAVDTGAYVVIAVVDGCNSEPDTVWVGMKPGPNNPNPTSTGPLCIGENIQFNADSVAGYTYLWAGPNGFSSSLRSPILPNASLADSGWYTLAVTLNGCTRQPDSTFVQVFDYPSVALASLANDSLCPSDIAQFQADSIAGASYTWAGPAGFTATTRNPQLAITGQSQSGWYRVTATVNGCSSPTDSVLLTVVPGPISVSIISGSDSLCAGQTATLEVPAVAGYQYQWLRNDSLLVGDTTAQLQLSLSGAYRVLVQAPQGCSDTSAATTITFTQSLPNTISSNILPAVLCGNDSVFLSASSGYVYQWLRNDTLINGATDSFLWVNQPGNYSMRISDSSLCEQLSNVLIVQANPVQLPSIQLTGNDSLCPGQSVQLSVTSTDSLQWLFNGAPIAAANDSSITATQAGTYRVMVTNSTGCSDTSAAIQIYDQLPTLANISTNQIPQLCVGDSLTITLQRQNVQSFSWFRDGIAIAHADTQLTTSQPGTYQVFVTGIGGCLDSSNSIQLSNFAPAVVNVQLVNGNFICDGDSTLLRATSTSPLSYQWQLNGIPLPNATADSLWVNQIGAYQLVTQDTNNCQQTFGPFNIQQFTPANTQISASGPLQICVGDSVLISALDTPGYRYQWFRDGIALGNDTLAGLFASAVGQYHVQITTNDNCSSISSSLTVSNNPLPMATLQANGAVNFCIGDSLSITLQRQNVQSFSWFRDGIAIAHADTQLTTNQPGTYQVFVTGIGGCLDSSNSIQLSNFAPAVVNVQLVNGHFICDGDSTLLRAISTSPLSYQWQLNGVPIPNATADSLWVNQIGAYQLITQDTNNCQQTFGPFNIQQFTPANTQISSSGPLQICVGDSVLISALDTPGYRYQWFRDGLALSNDTLSSIQAMTGGQYHVQITTNDNCSSISSSLTVSLIPLPSATLLPNGSIDLCNGDSLLLQGNATASSYTWLLNGAPIIGANTNQFFALAAGLYQLVITNANGCRDTSEAAIITNLALPVASIGHNTPLNACVGDTVSLFIVNPEIHLDYEWERDGSLLGLVNHSLVTTQNGTYVVVVTDSNGCRARSNPLVVNFFPLPNVVLISDSNVALCEFSQTTLEVLPIPNHSYQWFRNGVALPGANQSSFSADQAGTYRCEASSPQGCSNLSAEVTITLLPLPNSVAPSANGSICEGSLLQLSAPNQPGGYRWRGPAGFTSNLQNPSIPNANPTQSGWYYLQTESNGCLSPADSVLVDIQPRLPEINIQGNNRICVGNPIQFTATDIPNARYVWILPSGDSLIGRELTLENSWLTDSGTYLLRVSRGSCAADEVSINATVNDFKFFFPTAFTPNGDGLNDEFYPVTSFTGAYELRIYDRWGRIIFQTTDPQARWNGYIDGNLGAPSAYSYVLYYDGCRSAPEVVYGTVFLLR